MWLIGASKAKIPQLGKNFKMVIFSFSKKYSIISQNCTIFADFLAGLNMLSAPQPA